VLPTCFSSRGETGVIGYANVFANASTVDACCPPGRRGAVLIRHAGELVLVRDLLWIFVNVFRNIWTVFRFIGYVFRIVGSIFRFVGYVCRVVAGYRRQLSLRGVRDWHPAIMTAHLLKTSDHKQLTDAAYRRLPIVLDHCGSRIQNAGGQ